MSWLNGRVLAISVALALAVLLVLLARALTESRSELLSGDRYVETGESGRALERYRRAMRWGTFVNPYGARAADSLRALGAQLEEEGQIDQALLAWRSIAGSTGATRSFYGGDSTLRSQAVAEISRLMARQPAAVDVEASPSELAAEHRALLEERPWAHPLWGTLLLLGFGVWIAGLVTVGSHGFDAAGRLDLPAARLPFAVAVVGLTTFILGLLFA